LRKALWPNDTFVDFDHSVNVAINRIRGALDETVDRKFIETIPRVGYRLLRRWKQPAPLLHLVRNGLAC
jgi:DNA-binding winged helix-turn-helix (wHTH) protein